MELLSPDLSWGVKGSAALNFVEVAHWGSAVEAIQECVAYVEKQKALVLISPQTIWS